MIQITEGTLLIITGLSYGVALSLGYLIAQLTEDTKWVL